MAENKNPKKNSVAALRQIGPKLASGDTVSTCETPEQSSPSQQFPKGDQKFQFYVLFQHPPEVTIHSVFLLFFFPVTKNPVVQVRLSRISAPIRLSGATVAFRSRHSSAALRRPLRARRRAYQITPHSAANMLHISSLIRHVFKRPPPSPSHPLPHLHPTPTRTHTNNKKALQRRAAPGSRLI